MASKKQIIYPVVILAVGIGMFGLFMSMKKPPEEKPQEAYSQIVAVDSVAMKPIQLNVDSQGVVNARYETRIVAQVAGEIVELAEAFVRGGFVRKGQLLARIDPSDYDAGLIEAQANYAAALAALEIELAAGHVAKEEWKNVVSSAVPSDLGLRRPQLKQEQAKVKAAEAAVKRAKRDLERTEVVAPFDALIGSRQIGLGSYVGTGTELGKVYNTSVAEVRLPISTNELQYLDNNGVGAKVDLMADFAGQSIVWQATIARSEGVIDEQSRMSHLVAEITAPYDHQIHDVALRFGTYVSARVYGISLPQAAVIPLHLVNRGRVAVLDDQQKLRFKSVVVTREQKREAVITEGLNSGDQMITSAVDYPVEGMSLTLKSQMDEQSGGAPQAPIKED